MSYESNERGPVGTECTAWWLTTAKQQSPQHDRNRGGSNNDADGRYLRLWLMLDGAVIKGFKMRIGLGTVRANQQQKVGKRPLLEDNLRNFADRDLKTTLNASDALDTGSGEMPVAWSNALLKEALRCSPCASSQPAWRTCIYMQASQYFDPASNFSVWSLSSRSALVRLHCQ